MQIDLIFLKACNQKNRCVDKVQIFVQNWSLTHFLLFDDIPKARISQRIKEEGKKENK